MLSVRKWMTGVVALVAGLGMATDASATTINFQRGFTNALVPAYPGAQDTFLNSGAPDANNGVVQAILSGRDPNNGTLRTLLLRFDLSVLQGKYESIDSATITLYQAETTAQYPDFGIGLYKVSAANAGWVLGTKNAAAAGAGESTWNNRNHNTTPWAGSAGMLTPDVDYDATPLGTATYSSGTSSTTDKNGTPFVFTIPISLIEEWIAGANPGLLLQKDDLTTNGLAQFRSGDFVATTSQRPKLTIDYTPVPEPAGLGLLALAGLALRRRR